MSGGSGVTGAKQQRLLARQKDQSRNPVRRMRIQHTPFCS